MGHNERLELKRREGFHFNGNNYRSGKKLGMSRFALMKEVSEGNIVAHKRRSRWLFTEEDIKEYIDRNRLERRETVKTERGHVNIDDLKKSCPNIKWKGSNVYSNR